MSNMFEVTKSFTQRKFSPSVYDDDRISTTGRPRDTRAGKPVMDYDNIYSIPYSPISYITLYQGMYLSFPWRFAIQTKIQEKYRKGIEVKPLFSAICEDCEKKEKGTGIYIDTSPEQPCPECGGDLRPPSPNDKRLGVKWLEDCNLNREHLKDVMEEAHIGICVIDDGYILVRKDYFFDNTGHMKYYKVKEIIGTSPILIRPIMENRTATLGGKYWICPIHRTEAIRRKERETSGMDDIQRYPETESNAPKCKVCGAIMKDVKYVSIFHERGQIENYYIEGEIIHWKEYMKSKSFTIPPGVTLWVPSSIITYKDAYIRDAYMKQRKPRSMITVMTANPRGFFRHWDKAMERVKNDWQYSPVIPFEPEPGMPNSGGQRVQVVDLMGSMNDLDYNQIRATYERSLYQWYGIGNIFANIETKGGGKGEVEKLVISNRHVERSNLVDEIHPLRLIGLMVGMREHSFKIINPEDKDSIKNQNLQEHKDSIAQSRQAMGYDADLDQQTGEWKFRKNPLEELQRAVDIINTLLSFESGQLIGPGTGGTPGGDGQAIQQMTPKTDGNEFTGQATEKALGDTQMHQGDTKATPASSKTKGSGGSGPYTAPDGAGPFESKQALGGYMRTKQNAGGAGQGGPSGGGGPGGAPNMMGMEMGYSKEQYEKVLEIIKDKGLVSDYIMEMIEEAIDKMEDQPIAPLPEANQQGLSTA